MSNATKIVALCGGVGGAKLALGLASVDPALELSIVVNTADDFEHLGLNISPDIDTVTYTLAGIANPDTGWGRAGETWSFRAALELMGGDTWFRLGDKDLAVNVIRTQMLAAGETLSRVTSQIALSLGVSTEIVPMTDTPVRTLLHTDRGALEFQDYFVRQQCGPVVTGVEFHGAANAEPAPRFAELLVDPSVDTFVICPSNPFISIDPILAIPSVSECLEKHTSPLIAVSPVVGNTSLKGPTSKLMRELNVGASCADIARHYRSLIDGFVIDETDAGLASDIETSGIRVRVADTVMKSLDDRCRLAQDVVEFATSLAWNYRSGAPGSASIDAS